MGDFGISLGYEKDKCSICGKQKEIRYIYNKKDNKIVKICDECVSKHKNLSIQQLLSKYGKSSLKGKIEILTKEQLEKSGFGVANSKDKTA